MKVFYFAMRAVMCFLSRARGSEQEVVNVLVFDVMMVVVVVAFDGGGGGG